MRQLFKTDTRTLVWRDIPEPDLAGPEQALVRPIAVATCDADGPTVQGETWVPGEVALGHECVAEVLETGSAVTSIAKGDTVVVPFQISCGSCVFCAQGLTGSCAQVKPLSMYGFGGMGGDWGGMLTDVVRVPFADAMLVKLPSELDPVDLASASDNLPDAYRTVAPLLAARPGAEVLILGGGTRSIALYAVAIARALGAGRVVYRDTDDTRLGLASDLGAEVIAGELEERPKDRFPIVVDATASATGLSCACRSTEPGGTAPTRASSTRWRHRYRRWRCTPSG